MLVALCEQEVKWNFSIVIAAAIASYLLGAVWYMVWSRQWMQAAGIEADENGRPKSGMGPVTYLLALLAALMVAGMMRHILPRRA